MSVMSMTGPRLGATHQQIIKAAQIISYHGVTHLHEGDAIGADSQLYYLAKAMGCTITVHPPSNPKYRAFLAMAGDEVRPEFGYHTRNKHIVKEGNFLVGFPNKPEPWSSGGTAHAINYAREIKGPVILVWPNGSHQYERWPTNAVLRDGLIPTLPF